MLLYNIHIETTLRGSHWRQFAWVSWSLANGVWIIGEHLGRVSLAQSQRYFPRSGCVRKPLFHEVSLSRLKFPGVMEFNISAAILLLIALVLLVCGYDIYKAPW